MSKPITTPQELQLGLINRSVEMPEFTYTCNGNSYTGKLGGYRLSFPSVYVEGDLGLKPTEISWALALKIYKGEVKVIKADE